jgi:hypothetical protein
MANDSNIWLWTELTCHVKKNMSTLCIKKNINLSQIILTFIISIEKYYTLNKYRYIDHKIFFIVIFVKGVNIYIFWL